MQKFDEIALQCAGISEEDIRSCFNCDNEIHELCGDVAERQQTEQSCVSVVFLQAQGFDDSIGDKSVVIVADHDSFGGSSGAASIDEGCTVSWFLYVGSFFEGILWSLWFIPAYHHFY